MASINHGAKTTFPFPFARWWRTVVRPGGGGVRRRFAVHVLSGRWQVGIQPGINNGFAVAKTVEVAGEDVPMVFEVLSPASAAPVPVYVGVGGDAVPPLPSYSDAP